MIRVAAHKLGSVSSLPQSDTVLTILTQAADLQGQLCLVSTVSLTFQLTLIYMVLNALPALISTARNGPDVRDSTTAPEEREAKLRSHARSCNLSTEALRG